MLLKGVFTIGCKDVEGRKGKFTACKSRLCPSGDPCKCGKSEMFIGCDKCGTILDSPDAHVLVGFFCKNCHTKDDVRVCGGRLERSPATQMKKCIECGIYASSDSVRAGICLEKARQDNPSTNCEEIIAQQLVREGTIKTPQVARGV